MKSMRIFSIIMLVMTGVMVFITFYMVEDYKNAHYIQQEKELVANTQEYSSFISSEIISIQQSLDSLEKLLDDADPISNRRIINLFDYINENVDNIDKVYFIDDFDGSVINSSGYVNTEDIGTDPRHRLWYENIKNSTGSSVSEVYTDLRTMKPVITITKTIYDDGELQGVLAADLLLESLYQKYQFMSTWLNSYMYIIDPKGSIILHPLESSLGFSLVSPTDEESVASGVLLEDRTDDYSKLWKDEFSQYDSGSVTYYNSRREKVYAYYEHMPDLNWTIVSANEISVIDSDISHYRLKVIVLALVLLLILGAGLYYFWVWTSIRNKTTGAFTIKKLTNILQNKSDRERDYNVLFIDIRNFSSININYGKEFGDKVLHQFTKIAQDLVKTHGLLATTQQGNIIFVFYNNDWDKAVKFTLYLRKKLDDLQIVVKDTPLIMNAFFGLTRLNITDKSKIEQGLESIENLYIGLKKTTADNPLICDTVETLIEKKGKEETLKSELLCAIEEDRIVPFYQPIYNLNSKKINKFEVLMRIKDQDRYLSPFPYITIAEKHNIIDTVDTIVIVKALEYKSKTDLSDEVKLSINISGKVLHDFKFLNKIVKKVDELNINHSNIIFEITETQNIMDLEKLVEIINHFKGLNFQFSIDDFGTGFSSMYYLKCIPADYVKIDGSFVKDIIANKESYYIVEAIVSMANAFHIKTIAEFVEDQEISALLEEMGIDYGQGYYYGKPENNFNFHDCPPNLSNL